jgi:hypothetical protein
MEHYQKKVDDFLSQQNIAVAGYSCKDKNTGNFIYEKMAKNGYNVYAVNPKAQNQSDVVCYPDLQSIPVKVDGVIITAPPAASINIVEQCIALGIDKIWMHRSVDNGSYSAEAEKLAEKNGLSVIGIGCPMMFLKPDLFHRCFRWIMKAQGKFSHKEAKVKA